MKIVVCVKQVDILRDELTLSGDGKSADPEALDYGLNEWDASAVEQALRLRDQLGNGEVAVITAGGEQSDAALRRCLAMGANRATRVQATTWDPIATARLLAGTIANESPDLVLCGVQSSDSVQGSTGVALAQLLGFSWAAVVTSLEWAGSGPFIAKRELEGGVHETVELDLPALLTIQTGVNQPRYVTLRAIKQAEVKEIDVVTPSKAGDDAYQIRRMFAPPKQREAARLTGTPQQVAAQIASIIKDRL